MKILTVCIIDNAKVAGNLANFGPERFASPITLRSCVREHDRCDTSPLISDVPVRKISRVTGTRKCNSLEFETK